MSDEINTKHNNIQENKDQPNIPIAEDLPVTSTNISHKKEIGSFSNIFPAKEPCGCSSNHEGINSTRPLYVFAIGKIGFRFPNRSVEMELYQAIGQIPKDESKGLSKHEIDFKTLTDPNYRYIARQLCWTLSIENLETYILLAKDPLDIDRLAQALRPNPDVGDIDVIIGTLGPISPPEFCNGLMLPTVMVDQVYSFDRDELLKSIPRKDGLNEKQFKKTSAEIFNKIIQIADNAGSTDDHRAVNYLAVRYDEIYNTTQRMQDDNYILTRIEVHPSRLSGSRKVVNVVFTYENYINRSAARQYFVRVDVTEEFPFLISPMQEGFER
jgi:hypothetical protein